MAAKDQLATYRAKRRFDETAEPEGSTKLSTGARYLIQKHDATRLHYDFRLELDGVLLSWAVTRGPSYDPQDKRLAVRTEDHPLDYGSFEGIIPKGHYGGGTVMLWDTGSWEPLSDPHDGLKKGKLAFLLHGKRLRGRWALVRMRRKEKEKRENWLLIKERDEFACTEGDLLERETCSAISGRSMEQIADAVPPRRQSRLPQFVAPSLATLVDSPPEEKGWVFEVKYDGYRAIIATDGNDVRIFTRSGLDWTHRYPAIADAIAALNLPASLLDGEITVIDTNGRTNFGRLVNALEGHAQAPLSCFLFDILTYKGKDMRAEPLVKRRALVERLLDQQDPDAPLQLSESFKGDPAALLATACKHGLEGLIAKKVDGVYRSGRHMDWLKIKCHHEQEFIVIGFSSSEKLSRPFSSLLMGVRQGEELRYAGRVGSGYSGETLLKLAAWRDKHSRKNPPCDVPAPMRRGVIWVKPELVAEVAFADWTPDGLIRHGRFAGLRADKPEKEIQREMPKPQTALRITHPEKVVYPDAKLSKQDVAVYIQRAAPLIWPFVKNRFLSLVRCPDGVSQTCFFQRHLSAGFDKNWREHDYGNRKGKHEKYIYPAAQAALLAAVQMGVLEFHMWGSRRDKPDVPDRLVFDLDPGPGLAFGDVISAATRLRDVLSALGLASMPMLSGGKGIHVIVPLRRQHNFTVVKAFCSHVAKRLAEDAPQRFTASMSKVKRDEKIFIDIFRNEAGSTAIIPFSPRARPSAGVAWPCGWEELDKFDSASAMSIRLAMDALINFQDPWAGLPAQSLSSSALKAVED